jgi:putative transposase
MYFVTSCLKGSIPAEGMLDLVQYRASISSVKKSPKQSEGEWQRILNKKHFARADEWLDNRSFVRHFQIAALAKLIVDSFRHFAAVRYDVFAFVVMPSHLHWIFRPRESWIRTHKTSADRTPREVILHTFKRHTALKCNELLGQEGQFWQDESYEHCVRDEEEFLRCVDYVETNPVKAGLVTEPEKWPYSSAAIRNSTDSFLAPLKW